MAWPFSNGEILTATNLNAVTVPVAAFCKVAQDSQSFTDGSVANFSWDTPSATFDPSGWFSAGNASRVTPEIAGLYEISAWSGFVTPTTPIARRQTVILLNGASTVNSEGFADMVPANPSPSSIVFGLSTGPILLQLNGTTDFVECRGLFDETSGSGTRAMAGSMTVRLMSPT